MLGGRFGLAVHQHMTAWPPASEQRRLGVGYLRVLVVDVDQFFARRMPDLADGVKIIALLSAETIGVSQATGPRAAPDKLDGWRSTVERFVALARPFGERIHAVECLNAWDAPVEAPRPTPAQAVRCALEAEPILRAAGIKCLLGSLGGRRWRERLGEAIALLDAAGRRETLGGVCLQPYGRPANGVPAAFEPPAIDTIVREAHRIAGLPVWVTEYGLALGREDDGGAGAAAYIHESAHALEVLDESVLAAACYFTWTDVAGPAARGQFFGLRRQDGSARLAWGAFAGHAASPALARLVAPR